MDIVASLTQERKLRRMPQDILSQKIGVSRGIVSHWERRKANPTMWNLSCWAQALGYALVVVPSSSETELQIIKRSKPEA